MNKNSVTINLENYEKQFPFILNQKLMQEKGLWIEKPSRRYFNLTNKYKRLLECSLIKCLPLEQIDSNMEKSDLGFVPVETPAMDFYQATSGMGLNYIYLRNNIYIEKLSEKDLVLLESLNSEEDEEQFVKRTLKDVIYPYTVEKQVLFYGPENRNYLVDSASIIIGIRHNEFDVGLENEAFKENFLKKQEIISQLSLVISVIGMKQFDIPVLMIQYNEFSAPVLRSETLGR